MKSFTAKLRQTHRARAGADGGGEKILRSVSRYQNASGIVDGALLMAFAFIRTSLDRDAEAWAEKRAKRAEAGRSGGLAKVANASNASSSKQNVANLAVPVPVSVSVPVPVSVSVPVPVNLSTTTGGGRGTADKPPRASRFTPPGVEEVKSYCAERKNNVDPERFVDFYASKGWLVGKSKMKDWRAAVRSWERSDAQQKAQDKTRVRTSAEYREEADFFG